MRSYFLLPSSAPLVPFLAVITCIAGLIKAEQFLFQFRQFRRVSPGNSLNAASFPALALFKEPREAGERTPQREEKGVRRRVALVAI